jgi:two-component system response regulator VicR
MNDFNIVGKRILVVDDNKTISNVIKLSLEKKGLKVDVVDNVWDAMYKSFNMGYDAVILDNFFPGKITGDKIEVILTSVGIPTMMFTGAEDSQISKNVKSPIVKKKSGVAELFNVLSKVIGA